VIASFENFHAPSRTSVSTLRRLVEVTHSLTARRRCKHRFRSGARRYQVGSNHEHLSLDGTKHNSMMPPDAFAISHIVDRQTLGTSATSTSERWDRFRTSRITIISLQAQIFQPLPTKQADIRCPDCSCSSFATIQCRLPALSPLRAAECRD
jgi:hypothetical protein